MGKLCDKVSESAVAKSFAAMPGGRVTTARGPPSNIRRRFLGHQGVPHLWCKLAYGICLAGSSSVGPNLLRRVEEDGHLAPLTQAELSGPTKSY